MAKEISEYINEIVSEKGEPTTWEGAQRLIHESCLRLGRDRNLSYGPGNISKFGVHGTIIRMTDKLERIANIVFNNKDDSGEGVEDSFGDGLNYNCYSIMLNRSWWTLPLEEVNGN